MHPKPVRINDALWFVRRAGKREIPNVGFVYRYWSTHCKSMVFPTHEAAQAFAHALHIDYHPPKNT